MQGSSRAGGKRGSLRPAAAGRDWAGLTTPIRMAPSQFKHSLGRHTSAKGRPFHLAPALKRRDPPRGEEDFLEYSETNLERDAE